jgi:hypothetical protein
MSAARRTVLALCVLGLLAAGSAHAQLNGMGFPTGGGSMRPATPEAEETMRIGRVDLRQRVAQLLKKGLWRPTQTVTATRPVAKRKSR